MPLNLVRKEGGWEFHDVRSLVFLMIGGTFCGLLASSAISSWFWPDKLIQVPDAFERIVISIFSYYYGTKAKNSNGGNNEPKPPELP